ncbi:transmembrane protein 120 homolog [Daphnia carinata]|uniref:transmembrane protein 120 homolog n=1 Tax=Daphnia carinata TaxID=120202 RepID=UPI00257B691F|nr:transmembrane protein 120 homolog [Daphnia carinata]
MALNLGDIDACIQDLIDLTEDYKELEATHKDYTVQLEQLSELQTKCVKNLSHQRYRLGIIKSTLKKLKPKDDSEKEKFQLLNKDLMRRQAQLNEMEESLPKKSGTYLKIILGSVNVSFLNKQERFKYKDDYEKFKLALSAIAMGLSVTNLLANLRILDLAFVFLMVWYYCTLTIRESILRVNGSRIKGWWRAHHFISTALSAVLLTWPDSATYHLFRHQLMWFYVYISFVQYLQFRYQQGCLYRLKALGERHDMDITIEGFHSWMWRGLSFLLPFLYLGYFYQLYNAWALYQLISHPNSEWQIPVLSFLFLILFLGNILTTSMVIPQKLRDKVRLKYRFTRLDKYFSTYTKGGRRFTLSDRSRSNEGRDSVIQGEHAAKTDSEKIKENHGSPRDISHNFENEKDQ